MNHLEQFTKEIVIINGDLFWTITKGRKTKGHLVGTVTQGGYRITTIKGKPIYVHRLVWEMSHGAIPSDLFIDHIDGNKLNNRIENLRLVSPQDNVKNTKVHKHNSSGVMGVGWYKSQKKWRAYINLQQTQIHLGFFSKQSDAIKARKLAEKKYKFHSNHGAR